MVGAGKHLQVQVRRRNRVVGRGGRALAQQCVCVATSLGGFVWREAEGGRCRWRVDRWVASQRMDARVFLRWASWFPKHSCAHGCHENWYFALAGLVTPFVLHYTPGWMPDIQSCLSRLGCRFYSNNRPQNFTLLCCVVSTAHPPGQGSQTQIAPRAALGPISKPRAALWRWRNNGCTWTLQKTSFTSYLLRKV